MKSSGEILLNGQLYYLCDPLRGERVGLYETDDGIWSVEYMGHQIAVVEKRSRTLTPAGITGGKWSGRPKKRK